MAALERRYLTNLSAEDIAAKKHRGIVGGMWDELGPLQLEFMRERGLKPHHSLLDVGCGALRGGVHFVDYLEPVRYCGLDLNPSLLEAGQVELEESGLSDKGAHLVASDAFEAHRFKKAFDYAISVSLFTHLPLNSIVRCLVRVGEVLESGGEFYATFFEAPQAAHLEPVAQWRHIRSYYDANPHHYSFSEMEWAASVSGFRVEYVGEWGHPRNQRILLFYR